MTQRLGMLRWFPPTASPSAGSGSGPPDLNGAERKKASLVARIASRLMAGLLANPNQTGSPESAVRPMVRLASNIEAEARRVVADPREPMRPAAIETPSAQATAWRSGYLDGEAGRQYSYRGPAELEADYWDGMQSAQRGSPRPAAND